MSGGWRYWQNTVYLHLINSRQIVLSEKGEGLMYILSASSQISMVCYVLILHVIANLFLEKWIWIHRWHFKSKMGNGELNLLKESCAVFVTLDGSLRPAKFPQQFWFRALLPLYSEIKRDIAQERWFLYRFVFSHDSENESQPQWTLFQEELDKIMCKKRKTYFTLVSPSILFITKFTVEKRWKLWNFWIWSVSCTSSESGKQNWYSNIYCWWTS